MKSEIKIAVLFSLGLSLMTYVFAELESQNRVVTKFSEYVTGFGVFWFLVLAGMSLLATSFLALTFRKRSTCSRVCLLVVAAISFVGLFAPEATKFATTYFGTYQCRSRCIQRIRNELKLRPEFSNVTIYYDFPPNVRGEYFSISGDVANDQDYDELVSIVASSIDRRAQWKVCVDGIRKTRY